MEHRNSSNNTTIFLWRDCLGLKYSYIHILYLFIIHNRKNFYCANKMDFKIGF